MNEEENIQVEEKKEKKNNKKCIIIVVAIMIIAAITAGVLYFLNNKDDKDKTKTNTNKVENKKVSEYKLTGNDLQEFDLAFLKLENKEENKVYSPLSIKYTLEMLAEASDGETKNQINSIIGDYKARKYTNSDNMSFANMMFIRDTFKDKINKEYTDKITNKYNGEVVFDAFSDATNINKKISDKTFSLIDNILDDNDVSNNDYYLVNALAIDMEWVNRVREIGLEGLWTVTFPHEDYYKGMNPYNMTGPQHLDFNTNDDKDNFKQTAADYKDYNGYNQGKYEFIEIGAVTNKYDIVKTLGEDNIRATVTPKYEEWLENGGCGNDLPTDQYMDKYINEINQGYKTIKSSTDFDFYDDENIKVFAKDLKEYNGVTLEYVAVMPKQEKLTTYIDSLTANKLNNIIKNLKPIDLDSFEEGYVTEIKGYVPIYNLSYDLDLKTDLKTLGIINIFDNTKADLSKLTSAKGAYIEDTAHSANIDFSNEGIKASAVTIAGGLGDTSCRFEYKYEVPVKIIDLTMDNPFMFLIRDKATGEVWFTGTVYTPTEK